ncbi:sugar ABC transporter ATP-binding protein [Planctomycetota bacterium]
MVRSEKKARLEMRGISKRFGATLALDQVNLDGRPGEVHALVGENGAGKSTLMKILSGVFPPDAGQIFLEGQLFTAKEPLQARQQGIGMIYQELSLIPHLTVEENILLGIEPITLGFVRRSEMRRRAQRAMQYFQHPDIHPDAVVRNLSVSAQQLVEIARSLALGSRILVFDEPTSSLNQGDTECLFQLIEILKAEGITIIYISHFLEEVYRIADRITVLRDGAVVETRDRADVTETEVVHMMVGRDVKSLYPKTPRRRGASLLKINHLTSEASLHRVSLQLYANEILGLFGLVGAGRTEFLRALFGLEAVRSGEIQIGCYSGHANPGQRWQQGIGLLSENRKEEGLALGLSLADNVTLTRMGPLESLGLLSLRRQKRMTKQWIETLDIRCQGPDQVMGSLSGGNQQKAALARLLYHGADVLLLDEPTRGIDVAAKATIYEVLDRLTSGDSDKGVIMVSSYIPELLGVCDRIAVMCRGYLGPVLPVKELDEQKLIRAAIG